MQYRYTLGANNRLVDISDLTKETRHDLGPYKCLDCGDEMEPALGDVKAHHFRHKHSRECNRETYLHNAAKHAVFESFNDAVEAGKPFHMSRKRPIICRKYEQEFGKTCSLKSAFEDFDLTKHLQIAHIEKGIDGFVADVLLESADSKHQILVEIDVTHPCEAKKINSGLKIIETRVYDESDIAQLRLGLKIDGCKTREFNLAPLLSREAPSCEGCKSFIEVFMVYRSGKVRISRETLEEASKLAKRTDLVHFEVAQREENEFERPAHQYDHYIRSAHFGKGVPIKSCLLCRFSDFSWYPDGTEPPLQCFKKQGQSGKVGINAAANCRLFSPYKNQNHLEQRREECAARRPKTRKVRFGSFMLNM